MTMTHKPDEKHVIFVDASKCKGCKKCELACIAAHNDCTIKEAAKMRKTHPPRLEVFKTEHVRVAVMCRQCEEAPCAHTCPTGALYFNDQRRSILNPQLCAGCGLCQMACPYGAMEHQFFDYCDYDPYSIAHIDQKMLAIRCDLCAQWRATQHKDVTACEEACAFGAVRRVTFAEFESLERREAAGEFVPPPPPPKAEKAEAAQAE